MEDFKSTKSLMIDNIPTTHALYYNYPNPFKPITVIDYAIPQPTHVKLVVYDILGRNIATLVNGIDTEGYKSIKWNGINDQGQLVSAGMYFYHLQAGEYISTKKMVLLK